MVKHVVKNDVTEHGAVFYMAELEVVELPIYRCQEPAWTNDILRNHSRFILAVEVAFGNK